MKIYNRGNDFITFLEVPCEINLTLYVVGCPLQCPKCSWSLELNKVERTLTLKDFKELLIKYKNKATCVVFLGGEWENDIIEYLKLAKQNYKVCLYTGLYHNELTEQYPDIEQYLDYLKTGRYIEKFGALDSPTTNQRLVRLLDNKIIKGKGLKDV